MVKKNTTRNAPFIVELEPRSYAWCSCGESRKQPFCDGSHGAAGMFPKHFEITEKKTAALCGCKTTRTPPYCDGSHKKIKN